MAGIKEENTMTNLIMVLGTITFYTLIFTALALVSVGIAYAVYLVENK